MNMNYTEEELDRGDFLRDQRRDEKMERTVTLVYKAEFDLTDSLKEIVEDEGRDILTVPSEELEEMAIQQVEDHDFNKRAGLAMTVTVEDTSPAYGTKQNPIQITHATQSPEQVGLWCQYPDGLLIRIDKGVAGQGYDLSEEETRDTPEPQ